MTSGSTGKYGRLPAGLATAALVLALQPTRVMAQSLRFANHRDIEIPDYATIMIGPFYSELTYSQTLAYRYTRTSGAGTDFVFSNSKGSTLEDGSEFPLVAKLTSQNYWVINRDTDLEFSISATYMYFPLGTQEDTFELLLGDKGAVGNLSAEFRLNDSMKGTLYDELSYSTDYVDSRGETDLYGGDRYQVFENTAGINMDWLISRSLNIPLTLERKDTIPIGSDFSDQQKATTAPSLGMEYEVTGYLLLGIKSTYEVNEYTASESTRPNSTIISYETYAQIRATEQSQIRASVGVSSGKSDAGEDGTPGESSDSIIGELRLRTELTEHLSHELYGSRSLAAGFETDFDVTDTYGYKLDWKGDLASASLTTALEDVQPSGMDVTSYTDWTTTGTYSFPLVHDITMTLTTSYDVRENGATDSSSTADQAVDTTDNYSTWVSKASLSFYLMKDVTCAVSFEHMNRYSDTPELSYGRDIGAVECTYTHAF